MGITKVKLIIKNPRKPSLKTEGDFLVDTGAHYTVLPHAMVTKLGLKAAYKQEFVLADGKIITRAIGGAVIGLKGKELPLPVVLGEKDDGALLGVTTLEGFGLMIDPFKREIYHSRLMLG